MRNEIINTAITIIVCRKQIREDCDDALLVGLAASIKEHGILQPILVRRDGDELVVVDGERRLRAAKMAGLTTVPVIVDVRPLSQSDVLQRQLVTNCQRQDLSPIERARALAELMRQTKWAASEVAAKLGLSPASVSRSLALLELPDSVKGKVASGVLPASTAYEISRAGTPADQERLANEVAESGGTRDALAGRRRAKKRGPVSRPRVGKVAANIGGGRTVTLFGPGLDSLDSLIAWLEELLSRARKARPRGLEIPTFISLLRDEAKAAAEPRS